MTEDLPMTADPHAIDTAVKWLTPILSTGDLASVWEHTDPATRLGLAQMWLLHDQNAFAIQEDDRDQVAQRLADGSHDSWRLMVAAMGKELRRAAGHFAGNHKLACGTYARPVAPGIEAVVVFLADDMAEDGKFHDSTAEWALTIPVRNTGDRPSVLGLGWIIEPGWPPKMHPVNGSIG